MRISDWSSDVCSSDLSDMSALQKSVCFNLWHEDIAMDLGSVDTALLSALNGKNDFHQIAALSRKLRAAKTQASERPLPTDTPKGDIHRRLIWLIDSLRRDRKRTRLNSRH